MVLPLVGAAARGLLMGAAKGGAKKAVMGGAKKFVKGKAKETAKQTAAKRTQDLGRKVSKKVSTPKTKKVKAIKLPKSVYRDNQSSKSTQTSGTASFESISKQLDNINNTTSALVKASEAESKAKKEAASDLKDKQRIEKARKKEEELEKKKGGGGILSVGKTIGKNFGIFDFLSNIAMGGLVAFLLNNYETIENLFTTLGKNFQNPFNLLKGVITGISSVFAGPIKGIFNTTWKALSKGGQLLSKKMGQLLPLANKTFGSLGQGIVNFTKNVTGQVTGQGAKGVTKQVTKNPGNVASQTSKSLAKTAPKTAVQQASKATANNVMGKGATRLLKIGNIFKRVPVVGGLISVFIDMLLGEPLDRAVVGAIGGGIGAWIGGGIGSVVLPFAGTAAGAILGGMIGDWAGKALYELIKEKMGLVPPVDPKDRVGPGGVAGTGLTQQQFDERKNMRPGYTTMINGKQMVWNGLQFVEPSQYTPPAGGTATSTGTASSGGTRSGASPTGYSSNLGPSSSAQRLYNTLGITASQWKTYKDTLASIETSGYSLRDSYGAIGGSGNRYDGRYQMGAAAKIDAANILGIPVPSRAEFRNNPQLQEDMILAHAVQNHRLLSGRKGSQRYRDASGVERLSYLGFAHNQGWVHAANWLDSNMTKDPTRDGFGTSGTKFTKALRRAFGQPAQTSQSQQTTQPAQLALDVQAAQAAQTGTGVISDMGATTGGMKGDMVSGFPVTSGYGQRWGRLHGGIDIGTPEGTYVALDVDVEIVYSGLHGSRVGKGYGNVVDAWAPSLGLQFRLAHLRERLCSAGQKIPAGVPLGRTGGAKGDVGRGSSTGPHLHFEVDNTRNATRYGGMGNPSAYVGHLILSAKGPEGAAPNITAQLSPNQPGARPDVNINRRGSYDQMYGQGGITPIPIPGQQPSGGGGRSGGPMMSASTSDVVNSYYKSQLMGFLYKQG
jgi:murein DD-endopeptidase MepM/ murein hydrolase activator NlpD